MFKNSNPALDCFCVSLSYVLVLFSAGSGVVVFGGGGVDGALSSLRVLAGIAAVGTRLGKEVIVPLISIIVGISVLKHLLKDPWIHLCPSLRICVLIYVFIISRMFLSD